MKEIQERAANLLAEIKAAQIEAGRSEQGRLLAIAATDLEKATWALEKAGKN